MSDNEQQQPAQAAPAVLIPSEEKVVEFYGDELNAALVEIGDNQQIYVPLRPICNYLGLDWSAQFRRLKRNPILAESLNSVAMTTTELPGVGKGKRELVCIQLEVLPGWLFGIDSSRVKPDLRDKVIRYQRECYKVLWAAFQSEALVFNETGEDQEFQPSAALIEIRETALAVARMAEQQIELERLARSAHSRLDQAGIVVRDLRRRLGDVERRLATPTLISEAQATEVSQRVRALALLLTSQGPNTNHYNSVFSELYRKFGVAGYRQIRLSQYEQVLEFLESWRQAGTSTAPGE